MRIEGERHPDRDSANQLGSLWFREWRNMTPEQRIQAQNGEWSNQTPEIQRFYRFTTPIQRILGVLSGNWPKESDLNQERLERRKAFQFSDRGRILLGTWLGVDPNSLNNKYNIEAAEEAFYQRQEELETNKLPSAD